MTKFHINKHGVPAPCHAQPGNCPLGGEGEHFETKEEAQKFTDEKNKSNHGLLPNVEKPIKREKNIRQQLEHEMRLFIREKVHVEYGNKVLEGGVSRVEFGANPAFIITGEDKMLKHKVLLKDLKSITSLKKKNPEQVGTVLAKAIAKEPYYLVKETAEGAQVEEYTPKNYNVMDKWGDMYANPEEAETFANQKDKEIKRKIQIKEELKEVKKGMFARPHVKDEILYEHKEDFIDIEKKINESLKDTPGFKGIDFSDVNANGIQIRGFHKEVDGYAFGDSITIKYDFSNKDEAIEQFATLWKNNDNEESIKSFKRFVEQGEKYGWD